MAEAKGRKMRYVPLTILACFLLCGCDDRSGVRESLQQCESDPRAALPRSHVDDGYLRICMQAKGYVIDGRLEVPGRRCSDIPWVPEHEECYRPNNLLAKWAVELK